MTSYEFWNLILQGLSTILTTVTLGIAIWGLNTWKKEHVGKRKLELLEKIYPNLKRLQTNIPLLFRTTTTKYEIECINKIASKEGLEPKNEYKIMDCIDYRMQHTFFQDFMTMQNYSYFADIFLSDGLKRTYYALANLNWYFPIEYNSKSEEQIKEYQETLQKQVNLLAEHFINEIKKAA